MKGINTMKQIYENQLEKFGFHDAWVALISYENEKLELSLKDLTLLRGADGKSRDIAKAVMVMDNVKVHELCYPGAQCIYKNGELITVNEPNVYAADKIGELIANLKKQVQILDVEKEENGYYFSFDIINDRFFNCTLSFDRVSIEIG